MALDFTPPRCIEDLWESPWNRAPRFYPSDEDPRTYRLRQHRAKLLDLIARLQVALMPDGDAAQSLAYIQRQLDAFDAGQLRAARWDAERMGDYAVAGVFPASPYVQVRGTPRNVLRYLDGASR
jgi:hypothetical protein